MAFAFVLYLPCQSATQRALHGVQLLALSLSFEVVVVRKWVRDKGAESDQADVSEAISLMPLL